MGERLGVIYIVSGNPNKVKEIRAAGQDYTGIDLHSIGEFVAKNRGIVLPTVKEDGDSYRENALMKAEAFSRVLSGPCLADDSGLEVEALNNRPGIYSGRYEATDELKIEKLLRELAESNSDNRSARYVCSMALVYPDGRCFFSESSMSGKILDKPASLKGFGYDPVVAIDEFNGKTLGEIDLNERYSRGFRARAARKLFSQIAVAKLK